jgi:hypothetical protein
MGALFAVERRLQTATAWTGCITKVRLYNSTRSPKNWRMIQIERIAAVAGGRLSRRCLVDSCVAEATWYLADRDGDSLHALGGGEQPCCAAHIATAYVSLRGARIIARRTRDNRNRDRSGSGDDRRRGMAGGLAAPSAGEATPASAGETA